MEANVSPDEFLELMREMEEYAVIDLFEALLKNVKPKEGEGLLVNVLAMAIKRKLNPDFLPYVFKKDLIK